MAEGAAGQRYHVPSHVLARSVGDDTVLLDLRQDEYFSLGQVGTRIWSLVSDGASYRTIVDDVATAYAMDREVIANDVDTLLADLLTTGLIVEA